MKRLLGLCLLPLVLSSLPARAQDPDIDRLLRKLPPPEKLVQRKLPSGPAANDPAARDPLVQQLDAAMTAGQTARGLKLARLLDSRYPKSATAHFLHGIVALRSQAFVESAEAFRRTVALQPRATQAYLGLGLAEGGRQRFAQALSSFEKAAELDPKSPISWILQSACLQRMGRRTESIRAARKGTQLAPDAGAAWSQLARAESAAGHRTEALLAAGKAVRLSPKGAAFNAVAGVGSLNPNRPTEGVRILQRAVALEPKNSLIRRQLREFLALEEQAKKSLPRLRQRVAASPNSAAAWQQLGITYEKLERHGGAKEAFANARRLQSGQSVRATSNQRR